MRNAVPDYGSPSESCWANRQGFAAFGTVQPGTSSRTGKALAEDEQSEVVCLVDGIVYSSKSTGDDTCATIDSARYLLEEYLEQGVDCLTSVHGNFLVAWWEEKKRRLVLANDRIGQTLLFFKSRAGKFTFGSMLARVTAVSGPPAETEIDGFSDLLTFGFVLDRKTLFRDVYTLPPASCLVCENGKTSISTYWRLDQIEPRSGYDENRLDELAHTFRGAVRRAIPPGETTSIGLTGGLDSRVILAAATADRLRVSTYTGGFHDSTDVKLAKMLADLTDTKHVFRSIGPEHLAEWLEPMVRLQGGIVATLHSHPCNTLFAKKVDQARIQGIGGEYVRGFWIPGRYQGSAASGKANQFLFDRMVGSARKNYLNDIWRPEYAEMGISRSRERLTRLVDSYACPDDPVARIHYVYLHERCRKILNKAVIISRNRMGVYLPYLDFEWIRVVSEIPMGERISNTIQIDLIRRLAPELLDVPYSKDLLPLSTPDWKRRLVTQYRRLVRKVNNLTGLNVHSFPVIENHKYKEWIRDEMRETLTELLYSPDAAYRQYLRPDQIGDRLDQHFSGKRNFEHLISALAVYEVAHRIFR
ncbi:MAG: asparagine synthase-related protein [Pseudomonadota bacterium]|nr:asparagine synthase-related protein [Pseudomonadota bacterium]